MPQIRRFGEDVHAGPRGLGCQLGRELFRRQQRWRPRHQTLDLPRADKIENREHRQHGADAKRSPRLARPADRRADRPGFRPLRSVRIFFSPCADRNAPMRPARIRNRESARVRKCAGTRSRLQPSATWRRAAIRPGEAPRSRRTPRAQISRAKAATRFSHSRQREKWKKSTSRRSSPAAM